MSNLHIRLCFSDHGTESFEKKLHRIISHRGDVYVWDDGHPWFTHPNGIDMLKKIRHNTSNKLYLVAEGNQGLPKNYLGFETIDFCFFAVSSFYDYHLGNQNQKWKTKQISTMGKFLFLTGKPIGHHRVGLLYKIWKNGLIASCKYSFFGNTNEFREACTPFIDTEDQQLFFSEIQNNSPDSIKVAHTGLKSIHYVGIPYDKSLYEQTQFSVVSETHSWRGPPYHVTEKTWRAIMNCHPFLLAGQPGMIDLLESIGFDCYQSYLKKDYDKVSDQWGTQHNDNLIENIQHWISMTKQEWSQIAEVAVANQKLLFKYFEENRQIYQNLLSKIQDPKSYQELINYFMNENK